MIDAAPRSATPTVTVAAIPVPTQGGARLRRHRGRRRRAHHRLPREGAEPADHAGPSRTCASRRWATTSSSTDALHARAASATPASRRARTTSATTSSRAMVADGQARLRLRLPRRTASPARRARARLLARHRDHRGLLGRADGPRRDPAGASTSTTSAGRSAPGITHDPPAKFVFRDEANARVGIATELAGLPRLHHLRRPHPPQRPLEPACA